MLWIGVSVAVGLIFALTLIGASMSGGNRSHRDWKRRDGGPWLPGTHDHDPYDDWR